MNREGWYSAQCIFLHADKVHGPTEMYEERIVLLRAESMEAAIEQAEKDAEKYCRDVKGCRYIGYVNVFAIYDDEIGDGSGNLREYANEPFGTERVSGSALPGCA